MFFFPPTPAEVFNIAQNFASKKSSGHDAISVDIMKKSMHIVAEPLTAIFNKSMELGYVPSSAKLAKVCPIFKEGAKNDIGNYRSISVLPSFSKILEKLIYDRLHNFVQNNNLLIPNQCGFQCHRSTYMALMDLYDKITRALDKSEHVIGIFIDLKKLLTL